MWQGWRNRQRKLWNRTEFSYRLTYSRNFDIWQMWCLGIENFNYPVNMTRGRGWRWGKPIDVPWDPAKDEPSLHTTEHESTPWKWEQQKTFITKDNLGNNMFNIIQKKEQLWCSRISESILYKTRRGIPPWKKDICNRYPIGNMFLPAQRVPQNYFCCCYP